MDITLECPRCASTVLVRSNPRRGSKRQLGTCAGCGSVFSLSGGTLTYVDPTRRRWMPSSWRFRDLVEDERQRLLDPTPDAGSDGDEPS
jgi:hypothetical protein